MSGRHIDDVQASTVDEHFKLLLKDDNIIDPNFTNVTPNDLPNWYDEKLFKEGQNYFKRNIMSIITACFAGLIAIIVVPETLRVLIYTKKSSIPCVAYSRYTQTLLHIYNLFTSDPNDPDSNLYKTINVILRKHKTSSKRSKNAGIKGIYQRDMAITQFAFIGYVLIAPESIGMHNKPQEEEAYIHLWRVIGHMLEIPDRLNLCRKTAAETRELCQKVAVVLSEYLNNASAEFFHVALTILNALSYTDITLDKHAFLNFVYELHGIQYHEPLRWYSRLNAKYRNLILYLFRVPYIGVLLKTYFKYTTLLMLWYVKKWPVLAWLLNGKKNSQILLY